MNADRCAACGQIKGANHNCPHRPVEARFATWVAKADGCWVWTGDTDRVTGYGRFWLRGRTEPAHRVAFELAKGPIPVGLHIDHLCRVRLCVNPAHLEAVTLVENIMRGQGIMARNARKEECLRGHRLEGVNLRVRRDGGRVCRQCERDGQRRRLGQQPRYADGGGFGSRKGVAA